MSTAVVALMLLSFAGGKEGATLRSHQLGIAPGNRRCGTGDGEGSENRSAVSSRGCAAGAAASKWS
jgi:hypothetical protein